MRLSPVLALAAAAAAVLAHAAAAQNPRPHLEWRTIRTPHFDVHYPAGAEAWTRDVASRLETVRDSVGALVGYAPDKRVTVIVEDPSAAANGFAYSVLSTPGIVLWPTPPSPRSDIGNNRGPGEQLAVHEFAHIAHLTRPSRRPPRLLERLRPSPWATGPVSRKTPRWVREGYATLVEGRLTGSGRPNSVIRAAILRQWALEGRLPQYGQLDASSSFSGGSMAYLAGSAFLEWLAERSGPQSLEHLWRRLSARQERTFADAFAGVYGGPPHELYGLFTVEVTRRALEARSVLAPVGLGRGDTVQRLSWSTGDPAVSADGKHLAIALRASGTAPARVVVWETNPRPDTAAARARARLLERDPQDVPDVAWRPAPRKALATLWPVSGRGHSDPRFLPGGDEVLVVRREPMADGSQRPDLFVWRWRTGALRRVTHGAGIHSADPLPDGRTAVGQRCDWGVCEIVRVDLASGDVTPLLTGGPEVVPHRPRVSPDGRTAAAAVQERGLWRLALVDVATGARRDVPGATASRYDPAWTRDGRLVAVSEEGGVANLHLVDPATGEGRPLTRVTGAAMAPEPGRATGGVFFLSLHAGGLDLARIHPDSVSISRTVPLPPALAPAAPPAPRAMDTLPRAPLSPSHGYGIGPSRLTALPMVATGADGVTAGAMAVRTDPVGRLTVMARAAGGEAHTPVGGSLAAAWRGWRPSVTGEAWWQRHRPSGAGWAPAALDAEYLGGAVRAELPWAATRARHRAELGASYGRLDRGDAGRDGRALAWGEYGVGFTRTDGTAWSQVGLALHGALGRTDGEAWRRGIATLRLDAQRGTLGIAGEATYGQVTSDAPAFEAMSLGGLHPALFDASVLSQRLTMPALPFAARTGQRALAARASVRVGGLRPFYYAGSAGDDLDVWNRVVGVETGSDVAPLPLLRVPDVRFLFGAAYSLDEPYRRRTRLYVSVSYRP